MTITIGFACKNAIAVLSDSQMSVGDDFKQFGEPKIFPVFFRSGQAALVGFAGALDSANLFRDLLERKAKSMDVVNSHSIADAVELTIRETREKFLDYVSVDGLTPDERSGHLMSLGFNVVFAYYFESKPYLFHSKFYHGRAIRCYNQYLATGCGEDIASYILTNTKFAEMNDGDALGVAYYAIETCKRHSRGCGGNVQHLILQNKGGGKPFQLGPQITGVYERAFSRMDNIVHKSIADALAEEMKALNEIDEDYIPFDPS